ncbi:hypothetical protein L7F22_051603 [Adiantum nelumboides]|nr:hypothetical protein [Adiantum nelumboides]
MISAALEHIFGAVAGELLRNKLEEHSFLLLVSFSVLVSFVFWFRSGSGFWLVSSSGFWLVSGSGLVIVLVVDWSLGSSSGSVASSSGSGLGLVLQFSKRTYYKHLRHDRLGDLHPSIRNMESQGQHRATLEPCPHVEIVEGETQQPSRKQWCSCRLYCYGGRLVAPSTYRRHQDVEARYREVNSAFGVESTPGSTHCSNQAPQTSIATNVVASMKDHQQQTMDHEEDTLLDNKALVSEEANENCQRLEDTYPSLNEDCRLHQCNDVCGQAPLDDSHKDAHVQEGDTNIALEDKILQRVVQMQALWDEQQVSIEFQDQMLKLLFGQGPENGVKSLSSLLVQMPKIWKGDLGEITFPACWAELNTMYRSLGMVDSERYLICMGTKEKIHNTILYDPINEVNYVGNVMKRKIDEIAGRALSCTPTSLCHGHWPQSPSKYFESYKADENQKFVQWCLPFVLLVVEGFPEYVRDLGLLLVDIAHIFFKYTRDHGWSKEAVEVAKTLLASWRVRSEESLGANSSPLKHVAGSGEILDDIICHGNHDVFWCFIFERLVFTYVNIKSNNKENKISFTKYHKRRLLTWVLSYIFKDKDGLLPSQQLFAELHSSMMAPQGYIMDALVPTVCQAWHKNGLLKVSSVAKAKELWIAHLAYEENYPCGISIPNNGIIIGHASMFGKHHPKRSRDV